MISVVFPHAYNKENNKILDLNLQMLEDNTTCEWEPLILINKGRPDLVYKGWDWMMREAKYDHILWHNTDIVMAPNWDVNVIKGIGHGDWIGIELVECGAIGVHPNNIAMDFGRTAATFAREKFEAWAETRTNIVGQDYRNGFCWYSPSVWSKEFYERMGGFPVGISFPNPNDAIFREHCESKGAKFIVANSYAYHFQRAGENLGTKDER